MEYAIELKHKKYDKIQLFLKYIIGSVLTVMFWTTIQGGLWLATVIFFYYGIRSDSNMFMTVTMALSIMVFFYVGPIVFTFFSNELNKMRKTYETDIDKWGKRWIKHTKK